VGALLQKPPDFYPEAFLFLDFSCVIVAIYAHCGAKLNNCSFFAVFYSLTGFFCSFLFPAVLINITNNFNKKSEGFGFAQIYGFTIPASKPTLARRVVTKLCHQNIEF
jgi:hypothetical protein